MEFYINLAVSVVLQALQDRKLLEKFAPAFAKVFVKLEQAAESNLLLTGAIRAQRQKS
jgi:hypothetical protein